MTQTQEHIGADLLQWFMQQTLKQLPVNEAQHTNTPMPTHSNGPQRYDYNTQINIFFSGWLVLASHQRQTLLIGTK